MRIVSRRFDGGVSVELHGELDITTAAAAEAEMRSLSYQYDAGQITIDLTRLEFIDVRGTMSLKRAVRMFEPNGKVALRGGPPKLDVLLGLAACGDLFDRGDQGVLTSV
ncbi:MAG TPA: STAS domain-containing protein [Acidimicrobiales bacterium]|nr:STAS domain-containing protein [Acidimicrobiales bacterium]